MFSKNKKTNICSSFFEEKKSEKKKKKTYQKQYYGNELDLALAISKSLHDAEEQERIQLGLTTSSKLPSTELSESRESLTSHWFIKNEPVIETYNTKVKKRKRKVQTSLQLSNVEIQDRILTNNLAKILMENDDIDRRPENHSNECLSEMKRDNIFWNDTTYCNENLESNKHKNTFICEENEKQELSESLDKQNANDKICLRDNSLNNQIEFPLKEIGRELLEHEINEDNLNLETLLNLIKLCPISGKVHECLKEAQLLNQESLENYTNLCETIVKYLEGNNGNNLQVENTISNSYFGFKNCSPEILNDLDAKMHNDEMNQSVIINLDDSDNETENKSLLQHLTEQSKVNCLPNEILDVDNLSKKNVIICSTETGNLNETKISNITNVHGGININVCLEENSDIDNIEIDCNLSKNEIIELEEESNSSTENFNENNFDTDKTKPNLQEMDCNEQKSPITEADFTSDAYLHNSTTSSDYTLMKSSDLKRELQKFGLKYHNHHRAAQLLQHVHGKLNLTDFYDKSVLSDSMNYNIKGKAFENTILPALTENKSQANSPFEDTSNLIYKTPSVNNSNTKRVDKLCVVTKKNVSQTRCLQWETNLHDFFQNDTELLRKILRYEPLNLNNLKDKLKRIGKKCKNAELLKYLDNQGVTVCMESEKGRKK